jgi:hypothetical protein
MCEDSRQRAAAQRSDVDVVSAVLTFWLWQLVGMESMAALADQYAVCMLRSVNPGLYYYNCSYYQSYYYY